MSNMISDGDGVADGTLTIANGAFLLGEVAGEAGIHQLRITATVNEVTGTADGETLTGTAGIDPIHGLGGADIISGLASADYLYGGSGADQLSGGDGDDQLDGGDGNDLLIGGTGIDIARGGTGDDSYYVDNAADQTLEVGSEGQDTVYAAASYVLAAGQSIELMYASSGPVFPPGSPIPLIDLTGNEFGQIINGNDAAGTLSGLGGNDWLRGYGGDDTLFGGADSDTLDGGTGADYMAGGAGQDSYDVDNVGDVVVEQGDEIGDSGAREDQLYADGECREPGVDGQREPQRHRQCPEQLHGGQQRRQCADRRARRRQHGRQRGRGHRQL